MNPDIFSFALCWWGRIRKESEGINLTSIDASNFWGRVFLTFSFDLVRLGDAFTRRGRRSRSWAG